IQSWQRTVRLGDLAPHTELLRNIEGAGHLRTARNSTEKPVPDERKRTAEKPKKQQFGAEAVNAHVLRVKLHQADTNFPALVAHPVFRPVKVAEDQLKKIDVSGLVSNGAFQLSKTEADQVLLERADTYWDKGVVDLERVSFVASKNTESALAAYRDGT